MSDEQQRVQQAYARRAPEVDPSRTPYMRAWLEERKAVTLRLLEEQGVTDLARQRILDVGCGRGYWIREFVKWGADPARMQGIDLLEERIREAVSLGPAGVTWRHGSAAELPHGDGSFDLVMQSTVFSSVLDPDLRSRIAAEMGRVLAPGGAVLWYDFTWDNPSNRDVVGIPRREIVRLFPGWSLALRRVTLAPPLARRLPGAMVPFLYPLLNAVSVLRTHYVGVLRPPR